MAVTFLDSVRRKTPGDWFERYLRTQANFDFRQTKACCKKVYNISPVYKSNDRRNFFDSFLNVHCAEGVGRLHVGLLEPASLTTLTQWSISVSGLRPPQTTNVSLEVSCALLITIVKKYSASPPKALTAESQRTPYLILPQSKNCCTRIHPRQPSFEPSREHRDGL